jgi:hypothetical protein
MTDSGLGMGWGLGLADIPETGVKEGKLQDMHFGYLFLLFRKGLTCFQSHNIWSFISKLSLFSIFPSFFFSWTLSQSGQALPSI